MSRMMKLTKSQKIQLVISVLLTLTLIIAFPVMAWFSSERKVATVAKVNTPPKLSIKSGASEDIIQFKMSGIKRILIKRI